MKPTIVKQQAFGGDWFMFYCSECGCTVDCNIHPSNCVRCNTVIEWPKAQGEPPKNDLTTQANQNAEDSTSVAPAVQPAP